jgi:hypothetical protein
MVQPTSSATTSYSGWRNTLTRIGYGGGKGKSTHAGPGGKGLGNMRGMKRHK